MNPKGTPENLSKPGMTNNPNGRPKKGHTITDLMNERLDKEEFIQKVIKKAHDGDITAIKLIWNYLDGMPKQSVEHSGYIADKDKDLSNLTEEELLKIKEGQKIIDSKGIDINGDNTNVA